MSSRSKFPSPKMRPTRSNLAPVVPSISGGAVRIERRPGEIGVVVDWNQVPPAEQVFAADLAFAREQDGSPELVFVQTTRLDATQYAARALVVRYAIEQFSRRPEDHRSFQTTLERDLDQAMPGWGDVQPVCPSPRTDLSSVTVDADFEVIVRTGGRAAFIPVTSPSWNRFSVLSGKTDDLEIHPLVEVTLPTRALALLLRSWDSLAARLRGDHADHRGTR